jgi:hypothetical protein
MKKFILYVLITFISLLTFSNGIDEKIIIGKADGKTDIFLNSDNPMGLGVILGEPSGLYFRYYSKKPQFLDASTAWSFINNSINFSADSDFIFPIKNIPLNYHYGFGGFINIHFGEVSSLSFGGRIPLGIDYKIPNTPLDIFLELSPTLKFFPELYPSITGSLGFIYNF